MRTRKFGLLALVLGATMFGAACEDKNEVVVPPPVTVITLNIAPDPVPTLNVGQTVQLVSIVSGSATQTATWTSSNTAVAEVNATTGLVTAKAAGVAVITAVSTVDATARDAVTIQVAGAAPPPTPGQITISIQSINTNPGNDPVNPGNVQGTVNVIANVDIPTGVSASAIRVMVVPASGAAVEVCRQTFAGSSQVEDAVSASAVPVQINCTINTALLQNGVPRFPNGTYTVRVEVLNATGSAIASATSQPLIFANVDNLGITATASGANTIDGAGLRWDTGDLTVSVTPSIFSGATQPSSVTITVRDNGVENAGAIIAQRTVSTSTGGVFTTTFTKANNADGNNNLDVDEAEGQLSITATSVLGGNAGPGGTYAGNPLRLDNQAPDDTDADADVPSFTDAPNLWYGANTTITAASRITNRTELSDEGVNLNTFAFQYNANPAATNSSSGWTTFTSPTELPQTTTTNGFRVRAVVCDALGNCASGLLSTASGGDVTAPTIAVTSTNDVIIETEAERTAAGEIVVSGTENLSGFPANFVQVQWIRTRLVGSVVTTECLDAAGVVTHDNNSATAAPSIPSAGCPFVAQASTTVDIADGTDGYYQLTVRLVDQAGNVSATTGETFLVDDTAPAATVSGLTFTSSTVTVNGTVSDNVDLRGWDVLEAFTGANIAGAGIDAVPFTQFTADGTFGLPLTTSVAASGAAPLIRQVDGFALTNVGFGAIDVANNYGEGGIAFGSPTAGDGIDNAAAVGLVTPAPTNSGTFICKSGSSAATPTGCGSATNAGVTSRTVTFTAQTNADTQNPISTVYFYALVPASNGVVYPLLIGTDTQADLTILTPGNTRNWAYTQTLTTAILPPRTAFTPANPYNVTVFAVAVDAEGDAVSTAQSAAIEVR